MPSPPASLSYPEGSCPLEQAVVSFSGVRLEGALVVAYAVKIIVVFPNVGMVEAFTEGSFRFIGMNAVQPSLHAQLLAHVVVSGT